MSIVARELEVLHRSTRKHDFERILQIARENRAAGFVVGIPHNPNAPEGVRHQADVVRRWIKRLRDYCEMPVWEIGEYLTSIEARELARRKKRKPGEPIDDLAARIILQSFLDEQNVASATHMAEEKTED